MQKKRGKLVYGQPVKVGGKMGYSDLYEEGTKMDGSPGGYSVKILIPKLDVATIKAIKTSCNKAIKDKFKDQLPPFSFDKNPMRDGDEPNRAGKIYAGHRGCYYITARTKKKPQVIKRIQGESFPVESDDMYSGVRINVVVTPFVYTEGTGGVSFLFQIVRKIADDKKLSGYWECTRDSEGKVIIGKFVEGGLKAETFDDDDEYQEPDVKSDFDEDDTEDLE
jgi:hypothetical protein